MNIILTETLLKYVATRVQSGGYRNAGEYVSALIRQDQQVQRLQALRLLLDEGLASGAPVAFTPADWDELAAVAAGKAP